AGVRGCVEHGGGGSWRGRGGGRAGAPPVGALSAVLADASSVRKGHSDTLPPGRVEAYVEVDEGRFLGTEERWRSGSATANGRSRSRKTGPKSRTRSRLGIAPQ